MSLLAGLVNIGLAVAAAYGFGAYLGLLFTPLMCAPPHRCTHAVLFVKSKLTSTPASDGLGPGSGVGRVRLPWGLGHGRT